MKQYQEHLIVELSNIMKWLWLLLESPDREIFRYSLIPEMKKFFDKFSALKSNPLPHNMYLALEFDYANPVITAFPSRGLISFEPSEMFRDNIYSTRVKALMEKVSQIGFRPTDACNLNRNHIINQCENEYVSQVLSAELNAELNAESKSKRKKNTKKL